jgi:hypothetical protein
VLEVPGAIGEGDTPDEPVADVKNVLLAIIALSLDQGVTIPEPFDTRDFSGQLSLRLPPELHHRATVLAVTEGVSLNRCLFAAVAVQPATVPLPTDRSAPLNSPRSFVLLSPAILLYSEKSRESTAFERLNL